MNLQMRPRTTSLPGKARVGRQLGKRWPVYLVAVLFAAGIARPCSGQGLQFGSDSIADAVESITVKKPRSDSEQDRLLAATHFSYGRMLLQHGEMAAGLKQLQRAYRWDPSAAFIARDIVPIASTLGRHAEAVRYAVLSAERDPIDLKIVLPLSEILAEQGESNRAIELLERALAQAANDNEAHPVLFQAELGRLYLRTEQFQKAADALAPIRRILESPDDAATPAEIKTKFVAEKARWFLLLAEAYVRVKQFDDAIKMYTKVNEAKPDEPTFAFHQAFVAAEKGDWDTAGKHLDRYFEAKSSAGGLPAYQMLERVIAAQSPNANIAKQRLIERLEQIQQADKENVATGYVLAAKYLESDRLDEAAKLFSTLIERRATPGAFRSLGEIYVRRKDPVGYLNLLGIGVAKGELTRDFLEAQATALAKEPEFLDRLVETARSEMDGPARGSRDVGTALLLIAAKKLDLAMEFHERASASKSMPEHKVHELVGMSLLLSEQPQAAAKIFSRAIQSSTSNENLAAYHFYLATALALTNEHDAALQAANKCAELGENVPQFTFRPAWVLYHAKRLDESQEKYKELLQRFDAKYDSAEVREQLRQARLALSNIAVTQDRLPEAEEWLEQVLDEFPEDPGAQNDLGYLWADAGKHLNRALGMCQAAVESEPENGAYRDSLGWTFFRLGKFEQAIQELEKAASLSPDGVIFDHLGDAYWKAQRVDDAKQAWLKALTYFDEENETTKQEVTKSKLKNIDTR